MWELVDAGPRTGLRRTASKPLWKTRSVFQAGVGAQPTRVTSKARPCPRQGRQLPQATSKLDSRAVRERGCGGEGSARLGACTWEKACAGGSRPAPERTRPLAARRSHDLGRGRGEGRPVSQHLRFGRSPPSASPTMETRGPGPASAGRFRGFGLQPRAAALVGQGVDPVELRVHRA